MRKWESINGNGNNRELFKKEQLFNSTREVIHSKTSKDIIYY
jgi:hypothetical protein